MHGLLGEDNIWLRCSYLKTCNLRVQNNQNTEKIAFKVVQMKFLVGTWQDLGARDIARSNWSHENVTISLQNILQWLH